MTQNNSLALVGQGVYSTEPHGAQITRLQPSFQEIQSIAEVMYKSGLFKDLQNAAQAVVKVMAGQEYGMQPFSALQNIHLIQGKPTLSANAMAAAIKANPKYDYKVVQMDDQACVIEFYQTGAGFIGSSSFTIEDARKAGTQNLAKFARNMMFARAISNGMRWYCPDVFATAVYTPEEMGAVVDGEGSIIEVPQSTPAPAKLPPDQIGTIDEHGYVWCGCGEQARYVKTKSGKQGWICGKTPVVCEFSMKDNGEAGLVRTNRNQQDQSTPQPQQSTPAEEPHPLDDVADTTPVPEAETTPLGEAMAQKRAEATQGNPKEEEVFVKPDEPEATPEPEPEPEKTKAKRPPSHVVSFFAKAGQLGLSSGEDHRDARLKAINDWRTQNGFEPVTSANDISAGQMIPMMQALSEGVLKW